MNKEQIPRYTSCGYWACVGGMGVCWWAWASVGGHGRVLVGIGVCSWAWACVGGHGRVLVGMGVC